jgi:hypothetical protein
VRFQVLTAMSMKVAVLLDVAACSLVDVSGRFRGSYVFTLRSNDGGNKFPRNVCKCLRDFTVLHHKRHLPRPRSLFAATGCRERKYIFMFIDRLPSNKTVLSVYSPYFRRKSLLGVSALVRFGGKVYWWVD